MGCQFRTGNIAQKAQQECEKNSHKILYFWTTGVHMDMAEKGVGVSLYFKDFEMRYN